MLNAEGIGKLSVPADRVLEVVAERSTELEQRLRQLPHSTVP
jgi:hypothetical protein